MRRGILLGLVLCSAPVRAQVATPATPGSYAIERWNTDAGLPQNAVNAILQSRNGHLWLGTFGGLSRFDGTAFLNTTTGDAPELMSDRVYALAEDPAGRLWIGTEAGLSRMTRGAIKTFTSQSGFPPGIVRTVAIDTAGGVWFGTSLGWVGRVDGDSFRVLFKPHDLGTAIPRIVIGRRGTWISTDSGLYRLDAAGKPVFVRPAVNAVARTAVIADPVDGIWAATDSSIEHRTVEVNRDYRLPAATIAAMNGIQSLATNDGNVIWIGAQGGQLWRFRADSNALVQVKEREQGAANALLIDREGSVWLGNRVTGLSRIRRSLFESFTTADGLGANNTSSVFADSRGRVWTSARCQGASVKESANGRFRPLAAGEHPTCVMTIGEGAPGEIWLAGTGVGRWRDGRYEPMDGYANAPTEVRAIFRASDGLLWIAARQGIVTWDGHAFRSRWAADSLSRLGIHNFFEARDRTIWMASDRGLLFFARDTLRSITTTDGLPDDNVRAIHEDTTGAFWIATYGGGLARLSGGKFTTFTTADGLPDNYLSSIHEDASGNLWLSCNRGVFRVARRELESHVVGSRLHVVAYGRPDGMASAETNGGLGPAVAVTADGRLWYPTLVGVTAIDPAANKSSIPPVVSIDRLLVSGRAVDPDNGLTIEPGAGDLEVTYSGLSLSAPNGVTFRYKLEGWDKTWIEAGTRRSANYSRLSPNTYRFVVMAANRDGVWSADTASVSFTVLPYFWQTWWFKAMVVLMVAMIPIVQGRRLRRRQAELTRLVEEKTVELRSQKDEIEHQAHALEKQNEILAENVRLKEDVERIARHDLRSPLTSIISLAQIVREDGGLPAQHDASLQLIEQAGYRVLNMANLTLDLFKMEQGSYRLTPRPVDIHSVVERVLQDLQAVMRTLEVTCDVVSDPPMTEPVYVQGDELLSHSMLTNVIKNAVEASPARRRVTVTISIGSRVAIRVRNDGAIPFALRDRFFEKYATGKSGGTGLGAYSARLMAQTQGGSIRFETSDETGTTVIVEMVRADRPERLDSARAMRGPSAPAPDALVGPRSILLVDDDENTRAIVRHFLTRAGWTIDDAENGPLALRMFEEGHYDCVFMDIEMPVMGGLDVVGRMREIERRRDTGHAVIVALSSHDDAATRDRAIEAGFDRYLTKPASRRRVVAMVTGEELPERLDIPPTPAGLGVTLDQDLRHLLPSFIERKIVEAESLLNDLERRDADDLRRLSHKMRGSLSLYGFAAASRTCAEIEHLSESSEFEEIAKRLPVLREQLAEIERRVGTMNVQEA